MTKAEYITQLDQRVRSTTFNDAQGSSKDSALLGPSTVEFAPYGRIPNNKVRKDARQGTIDQDEDFIEFLESLTNPIPKATVVDQENDASAKSKEKVTTTPLIQHLRDKKANKGKETPAAAKGSKHTRQDSKDSKASLSSDKKSPSKPVTVSPPDKRSAQAIKVENAARDAVKALNKQATKKQKPESPPAVVPPTAIAPSSPAPLAEKKRERGNASVAARILQRDLGLGGSPGRGGRGGRRGGSVTSPKADATSATSQLSSPVRVEPAKTENSTPTQKPQIIAQKETPAVTAPSSANSNGDATEPPSTNPSSTAAPPTGPAASRNAAKQNAQLRGSNVPPNKLPAASRGPAVSPTATQAFLKHANPSQGITEPLLEEAFSAFGSVTKVEIDKKKGFAYVDFAEPDGLQKAITASPLKVAQGQVVVLERKTGPTLQTRNTRGGSAMIGNRGGGVPMGPRGGRGGSMRRGGSVRPAMKAHNPSTAKPLQAPTATSTQPDAASGSSMTAATLQESKPEPASQPAAGSTMPSTAADT